MPLFTQNILIAKFGALGDVVRTAYLLPGLAAKYPAARICWLTSEGSLDLLRFNPFISLLATPHHGFGELQAMEFDLVLSLDDELEILRRVSRLRAKRIVGARLEGDAPTYCSASAPWFDMGLISRFGKERADALKKENKLQHHQFLESMTAVRIVGPSFFNSPRNEEAAARLFDDAYFNVGLNSGSGGRWPSKQLSLAVAADLIRKLLELEVQGRHTRVVLLGGPAEHERHAQLRASVISNRLLDSGNHHKTLEFAAIVKRCDYLITSDSLALHLGISQKVPNLSFYAPTSAVEIGTFGLGEKVQSLAPDYCNYKPDADTSTITSSRLFASFTSHLEKLGFEVRTTEPARVSS